MSVIFSQVAILVLFALAGWGLCRGGIVKTEHAGVLSRLLVWVFLPAKLFQGFSKNCTVSYLSGHYPILLLSVATLAVLVCVFYLIVPRLVKNKEDHGVYKYSLLISNYGYMGYALVEAVYGEMVLLDMMLFGLPVSLYIYTEGYRMLTGAEKVSFRRLINPVVIAILVGCAVGLSTLPIPSVLSQTLTSAADCTGPISMLLAGITIAEFRLSDLLLQKGAYVVSVMKLLVVPLAVAAVLQCFFDRQTVIAATMIYCMPCGLNTIVFPKLRGLDCRLGAAIAMISTALSLATIPLCSYVVEWLCK